MKKLSPRHRKLLLKRSRAGNRRVRHGERIVYSAEKTAFLVDMWDGKEIEKVICLSPPEKPPSVLCFHRNTDETLKFIWNLNRAIDVRPVKRRNNSFWVTRRPKRRPQIKKYFSFEEIEFFSTAPALILAAIYERAKEASGQIPPAINFPNWSANAFQTLYEIGFFEIVGHAPAEKITEVYNDKLVFAT